MFEPIVNLDPPVQRQVRRIAEQPLHVVGVQPLHDKAADTSGSTPKSKQSHPCISLQDAANAHADEHAGCQIDRPFAAGASGHPSRCHRALPLFAALRKFDTAARCSCPYSVKVAVEPIVEPLDALPPSSAAALGSSICTLNRPTFP
eukprot:CAMPEP_0183597244 /NCGR_PEP_ID=MMETSP0371-20130417/176584_1 /TAXON_ID=268820 /ORGANISM="Peridinium aciculiferum, Strain PAER-2" /LENGTH=146 /DNA_ID=CAMNT_0025809195 /DNA_START=554 /DNA_END=991 /DNA_ORIENTATION=+